MKSELKKIIEKVIKGLTAEPINFSVEIPAEKTHGDYSTNVVLVLAKKLNRDPIPLVNALKDGLSSESNLQCTM
jgi:arginyl-tRNA synthetase